MGVEHGMIIYLHKNGHTTRAHHATHTSIITNHAYTKREQAIAMGVEHGMIIGLEEDRQGLLNKRLEVEKAETLAQVCV
jgi:hypothetical protein